MLIVNIATCQEEIPLGTNDIPNQNGSEEKEIVENNDIKWIKNVQQPSIEVYLPSKRQSNKKAVIICPGGGYSGLAYDWEGLDVAKWFNSNGIAAFVLKYRLPGSKSIIEPHKAPLMDAKRAIRLVRSNAHQWNIDPEKIGIMGYSAGGHLASTLATHYNSQDDNYDDLSEISARPDFTILIYPVITMKEPYTHQGSRNNLIGKDASDKIKNMYSNELHIDENTPATFLVHSSDDEAVHVMNSILFYQGLQKNDISCEMHIYPMGGHGYSFAIGTKHLQTWPDRLSDWLNSLN